MAYIASEKAGCSDAEEGESAQLVESTKSSSRGESREVKAGASALA